MGILLLLQEVEVSSTNPPAKVPREVEALTPSLLPSDDEKEEAVFRSLSFHHHRCLEKKQELLGEALPEEALVFLFEATFESPPCCSCPKAFSKDVS